MMLLNLLFLFINLRQSWIIVVKMSLELDNTEERQQVGEKVTSTSSSSSSSADILVEEMTTTTTTTTKGKENHQTTTTTTIKTHQQSNQQQQTAANQTTEQVSILCSTSIGEISIVRVSIIRSSSHIICDWWNNLLLSECTNYYYNYTNYWLSQQLSCSDCRQTLKNAPEIITIAGQSNLRWHPACFKCNICHQPMDKRKTCHLFRGQILCQLDYANLKQTQLERVKCARCRWPISASDWVSYQFRFLFPYRFESIFYFGTFIFYITQKCLIIIIIIIIHHSLGSQSRQPGLSFGLL